MSSPIITPSSGVLSPSRPRLLRQVAGSVAAGVAVVGAAAAWQGARVLHDKPGEQALARLVPENTLAVVSVDAKPSSWEQVQVMRQIQSAISQEQLPPGLTHDADEALNRFPALCDVKPYLLGSGAFAVWLADGQALPTESASKLALSKYRIAGVWAVSSPGQVESVLKTRAVGSTTANGVDIRQIALPDSGADSKIWSAVIGSYLVVGSSEATVSDVAAVWRGSRANLAGSSEYAAIRATLPADANVIGYLSPQGLRLAQEQTQKASGQSGLGQMKSVQGMAFSATVRIGGLRFDSTTQTDDARYDALRNAPPLNPRLLGQVPDGAMAFVAFAQPRSLFDTAETLMRAAPADARKSWDASKSQFEKESGLNISRDILPGFGGDAALAVYPGEGKEPVRWAGFLSDARQAQPAQMLQKVQTAIEKQEPKAQFTSNREGGVTYWSVPEASAKKAGLSSDFTGRTLPSGDVSLYAQVGQSTVTASSRSLLETAVSAYQSPRPVSAPSVPTNAQMLMIIRPTRVLEAIEHASPGSLRNTSVSVREMGEVWGGQDLVMSASYGPKYFTSSAFLPVRFDKAVSLMAKAARDSQAKSDAHE